MAHKDDIALMAHLMRRAGFGADRDELEARVVKGYDATVEELLDAEMQPPVDPYTLLRYQPSALLPGGVPPMGDVNYTEVDVREASRAFTGWTFGTKLPRLPYGRFPWKFEYRPEDHDDGEKTFLGHTGNFNGEDIIDIIVQQPACAKFICRHLYNFFVADDMQVPAWMTTPPRDPEAVDTIARAFKDSQYDMRSTLRVLFNSDFFKNARFAKIKSPAEVVVGILRLAGGFEFPAPGIGNLVKNPTYMGQEILNPPSVEGWHTGAEWINSGTLMKRINFAAGLLSDVSRPGIRALVHRLQAQGDLAPSQFVDSCLDLIGPMEVEP